MQTQDPDVSHWSDDTNDVFGRHQDSLDPIKTLLHSTSTFATLRTAQRAAELSLNSEICAPSDEQRNTTDSTHSDLDTKPRAHSPSRTFQTFESVPGLTNGNTSNLHEDKRSSPSIIYGMPPKKYGDFKYATSNYNTTHDTPATQERTGFSTPTNTKSSHFANPAATQPPQKQPDQQKRGSPPLFELQLLLPLKPFVQHDAKPFINW